MTRTNKTDLLNRLAELERENATLKIELGKCQDRSIDIENPDRLLAATAKATKALLSITNLDEAVNTALQIVGEGLDTDRLTVIENFAPSPNPSAVGWRVLYEWTSPHAIAQIDHPDLSAIERDRTQQALLAAERDRSQQLERHNIELQQTLDRLTASENRYRRCLS